MSSVYESIMHGLNEAIDDAKGKGVPLKRNTIAVVPVKQYKPAEIKRIRTSVGMSQKVFASYIGVSGKTVEAWEAGQNHPAGAASRILSMMEMDSKFTEKYPFIKSLA